MEIVAIGQPEKTLAVLKYRKLTATAAKDGIEGIREILRCGPDFAVIELDLPHLHGYNLAKILEVLELKVPIIFTADTDRYRDAVSTFESVVDYIVHDEMDKKLSDELLSSLPHWRHDSMQHPFSMSTEEWENLLSVSGRHRILYVEDDPETRLLVTTLLRQPGEYEMYTAENGLEGLRKSVVVNPDLIIADINMPVLDGLTMSQILYIIGKPNPIMFLSSSKDDDLLKSANYLDGVVGYMLKEQMKNLTGFRLEVQKYVEKGRAAIEKAAASYRLGRMEDLLRTGTDHGVLKEEDTFRRPRRGNA